MVRGNKVYVHWVSGNVPSPKRALSFLFRFFVVPGMRTSLFDAQHLQRTLEQTGKMLQAQGPLHWTGSDLLHAFCRKK